MGSSRCYHRRICVSVTQRVSDMKFVIIGCLVAAAFALPANDEMIATDPLSTEDFSQGVVNRREGDFLEAFKKLDDEIKGDPKQDLSKEPDVDALVEESNDFKPPMPAMVLTTNAGDYVPSAPISGGLASTNANTAQVVSDEAHSVVPQGGTVSEAIAAGTAAATSAATAAKSTGTSAPGNSARAAKTTGTKKAAKTEPKKGAAGRTMGVSMATAGLAVLVAVVGA